MESEWPRACTSRTVVRLILKVRVTGRPRSGCLSGVTLMGGFAGVGASDPNARDITEL